MKKWIILPVVLLQLAVCSKATVYWDGEGNDGLWSTAMNWSANTVPSSADDVVLDNSIVAGNYTVSLPPGIVTVSIRSLVISPSANASILLHLPAANTANPGLTITGPGTSFILNNQAVFKNSSSASAGSGISVSGTLRINNGGHYIHNTSRGNASIVSQLSNAAGTETGVFEFDVPVASYVLSLSGRTFGTLVLSSTANNGTVSYSGSGANTVTINGNFQLNAGVSFSLSMSGSFLLKGNYNQAGSSVFNLQSSTNNNIIQVKGNFSSQGTITETNTGQPVIELNGISNQDIDAGTAVFLNQVDFRINNPAGVTLLNSLVLPYRLSISSGNVIIGNHILSTAIINQLNPATMTTNHIVTNGNGFLKLTSVGSAVFPVGPAADKYNPLHVTNGGGNDFYVRVENGINPSIAFPTFGINRTWTIYASAISAGVGVGFQYASADANANALQPQDMEILLHANNAWNIIPGNTNIFPSGADPAWVITTPSGISINNSPTAYALGVDGGWALPVGCSGCIVVPRSDTINRTEIIVYPNPVGNELLLKIKSPSKDKVWLTFFDVNGQVRFQKYYSINRGVNLIQISTEGLHSGFYFLKIEGDKTFFESRFFKGFTQ